MSSILFVCTGNTCRSPMAVAIFKDLLAKNKPRHKRWRVESAGTWANDGDPAAHLTEEILAHRGLSVAGHRARTVHAGMLGRFDLILTMTAHHKEALLAEFPQLRGKVYLLSQMAGVAGDIDDPMGGTAADYQTAASEITRLLQQGFDKILELTKANG